MPRFAANLSLLYPELGFIERFAAAVADGFEAVECQFPYQETPERLLAELQTHQLQMVLHNLPAGDWAAGERGIACHPDRVDEFRDGVQKAIRYALTLSVPRLNVLAGLLPASLSVEQARAVLVSNLRHAAQALAEHGLQLLLEPINGHDMPGFLVQHAEDAISILDEVGCSNVFLQLDLYHSARMAEDTVAVLRRHVGRIGHIQLADCPGRHEPGTGQIDFSTLLAEIDRLGYSGWVGCEYLPADPSPGGTTRGLGWR